MRAIKLLLMLGFVLIILFIASAFITHNQTLVEVNLLLVPVIQTQLAVLLIMTFVVGGLCGLMASTLLIIKEKAARRRIERRMQNTSKLISGYHA